MQRKLIKAWGPYAVGSTVVDNREEAEATPGAVRVSRARFAKLQEDGHFAPAEPERPIPFEVRTSGATSLAGRPLDEDGAIEFTRRSITPPETAATEHGEGTSQATENRQGSEPEAFSLDNPADKKPATKAR